MYLRNQIRTDEGVRLSMARGGADASSAPAPSQHYRDLAKPLHQPNRIYIHNHLRAGNFLLRGISQHRPQRCVQLFAAL